jgi:tetratricopeptide (TPR) repeat protein
MTGRFANLEFDDRERDERKEVATSRDRHRDDKELLRAAHELYRWGRFEPALRLYTRCLEANRTVVPAWVGQVQMLVQLNEHHEARVWSDKALEIFRNNGELLAAKGQACARLHDHKAAMACSDGSVQVPGSSPWRWIVRGEVLLAHEQKHFEDCFRKALLDPLADWFDRIVIARIYRHYGRPSNALAYLKEALEGQASHGYVWFETGLCQMDLGLIAAARDSFERCLSLRPDYREARVEMARSDAVSAGTWLRGMWRRWRKR